MRSFQFWILMIGSTLVSLLMLKQISLSRAINTQEHALLEEQSVAATAAEYSNAWQTLATHIYQASRQDPAFADILKQSAVDIRTTPPPGSGLPGAASAPATNSSTSVVPGFDLVPPSPSTPPKPGTP